MPSLWIDVKYVNLLSCHLGRFSKKGDYLWNFRCVLCGDSSSKKTKARGYIYQSEQRLAFKCHNCNASLWLGALIKHLNPRLYKEYLMETFKESNPGARRMHKLLKEPGFFDEPLPSGKTVEVTYKTAEKIKNLPKSHYALQYVKHRQIPETMWSSLLFTERYKDFCDEVYPTHGKNLSNDARLVLLFIDTHRTLIAVSGRAFDDKGVRYVTVRTNTDDTKLIYGLERVDQSKTVYITEGPLDSLFVVNAVASGDANLMTVAKQLSAAQVVLVYDNEARNKEIVNQIEASVKAGYSVVIWPEWMIPKDINDMVLSGYSTSVVADIISTNTFSGLTALTHLNFWKKCYVR